MSSQEMSNEDPERKFYHEAMKMNIDGYKMVNDIHLLCGLTKRDLPLAINLDWHPEVKEIYKKIASGEVELPDKGITSDVPDNSNYFIYERDPIDDWDGYHKLHVWDIFNNVNWRKLIYQSLTVLNNNSAWEGDIREGPYVAMLPGNEYDFADWVVLLKQDNNGTTFVVSNYKLDYLDEYFVKSIKGKKTGVSK